MGGRYFVNAAQPLLVPRMGKMVYYVMKNRIIDSLKKHFLSVNCPFEAPEKESFGDIDIAVRAPIDSPTHNQKELYELLFKILKPERLHTENEHSQPSGDLMFHAAIRWPKDVPEKPFDGQKPKAGQKLYIQLDIRICETAHSMNWNLFKHAHGDIWSILGSTIRLYGLTVDEEAMYTRIPEIEYADRKRARVTLTSDPDEILDFLGLDAKRYWKAPFLTFNELFEFVAQCPMFFVPPGDAQMGGPNINASDRKRIDQRPGYRRWVEEFLPACRQTGRFQEARTTRVEVQQQALERFNAKDEYEQRLKAYLLEKQKQRIWFTMIKVADPPPAFYHNPVYRTCFRKALKKIILEGSEEFVREQPDLMGEDGFYDEVKVRQFMRERGPGIGLRAYEAHQASFIARKGRPERRAFGRW